jgi:hypothetical protein
MKGERLMELNAATDYLGTNELLCDVTSEQPVEGEFTIPDYQPEIFKIIKAKAEPVVVQKIAVGSRATVDGYMRITVIYQSGGDKGLFSLIQKLPFSKQADLREPAGDNSAVFCSVSLSYLNCRAVNQRRVDLRGAANISIRVLSEAGSDFISDLSGEGAQQRQSAVEFVRQSASAEKQFTIEESLAAGLEPGQAPAVLRCDAKAYTETVSIEAGRAVVAGSVNLGLALDISDQEEYRVKRASFSLPFNQVVDISGADDAGSPLASVSVLSAGAELEEDGTITASVLLALEVKVYENSGATLVSDAYSTKYELDIVRESVSVTRSVSTVWEPFSLRQTVAKPAVGAKLIDYFVTASGVSFIREDGATYARASAVFSYILSDATGDIACWDQPFEFDVDVEDPSGTLYGALDILVSSLECTENDDSVSFKAEGSVFGCAMDIGRQPAVSSVSADTAKPTAKPESALVIYYAEDGEDIFEIAKAFSTSPLEIARENNISDGILGQKSMLLIPIVE